MVFYFNWKSSVSLNFQRRLSQLGQRHFSQRAVDLSYTSIIPENGNATENPLLILHGLFGSKRNWGSFLKAFHRDMPERPLYALDLRNHGASPHATPMTYEAMVEDVNKFVDGRNLKNVTILGHSIGGKVAMAYALSKPDNLSNLVVADIAPSIGNLSSEFIQYISLMQEIENLPPGKIKARSDADKFLLSHDIDISIRHFLLTNLHIPAKSQDGKDDKIKFIVPLHTLSESMPVLGSFPYQWNESQGSVPMTWSGPTLAIKGTKSLYINHKNLPVLRAFFPNARIEELDAGHWVHAEKPTEFRKLVVDFLARQ